MVKVLDASALLAYLEKEAGFEKVKDLFIKAANGKDLLMTTINLGEVYYIVMREYGFEDAEKILNLVKTFPIEFVAVDWAVAHQRSDSQL